MCYLALYYPKMSEHEEYHLVLIYHYYLVSMWYVLIMRNSNSIMSINFLYLDFYLPLVKKNIGLSHYGGVICYVHITSLENVNM